MYPRGILVRSYSSFICFTEGQETWLKTEPLNVKDDDGPEWRRAASVHSRLSRPASRAPQLCANSCLAKAGRVVPRHTTVTTFCGMMRLFSMTTVTMLRGCWWGHWRDWGFIRYTLMSDSIYTGTLPHNKQRDMRTKEFIRCKAL